ncbi:dynein regulatory complex subunit 3-like [Lineus longissimus]|uniref:dynein regulatory complex subunit 3-like n=1 Tax=Lineus longissimus TaxID=88925 RepID=UPI002B4D06FA
MSRLYDAVEPSVIDEDMLQRAVEEQGPRDEAGRIAKQEGIDFADVLALRLDFKNILKIDNLWCFTSLTKLQMDNNIIEKIEGLDMLVNLVWLDLSFNNIEAIEGLDKLTRLEDLTLYNNRISRIENMETLNLHVFSIGNNNLKELDNLVYLRRFKKLRTLNLSGNPFCDLSEYKVFVIAHLPNLDYLDYRLIDENSKGSAYELYQTAIEELDHDEAKKEREEGERTMRDGELKRHKAGYIENLNGPYLFDSLYQEDTEGQKLNFMPTVDELLITFKEKFVQVCLQIFEYGLEEHSKREEEVHQFTECVDEAKQDNKQMGMLGIAYFMEFKKKLFQELPQYTEQKLVETSITDYHNEVSELRDKLMGYELQLVDQLEESIKDFERNLADMVSSFIENVQGLISQCRDLENMHHEKLLEIAIVTLEKVVKNELDDEIPEDLRLLFVDKDTIINAVTSSHDVHLLKIDNREDDIVTRINSWMSNMIEGLHEDEITRNRNRVSEITNLIDHLRDEIDTLDLQYGNY